MSGPTVSDSPVASLCRPELALRVVGTEHDGRILRLRAAKCTIGSAQGCTLRLRAPGVHAVHCLIVRGPAGMAIRSWATSTRLNGRTFVDAPLATGDRLSVGPLEFEVVDAVETTSATATATAPPAAIVDERRLAELEQKSRAAEQAREELARRLAERDEHVARLNAQLAEAESLVEQARREASTSTSPEGAAPPPAELEALQRQVSELSSERDAWQEERNRLQGQLVELERRVLEAGEAAEHAREEAQLQAAAWQREREHLKTDLHKAQQGSSTHFDRQRELREMEVAMTHWREKAEEQTRTIADLHRQLGEAQGEASEEQQKLRAELEAGARELDSEAERLLEREEALEKRIQAWEAEQAAAAAALAEGQTRAQDLQQREAALEERCAALDRQAAELSAEAERLVAHRQELARQQELLEQRVTELEAAISQPSHYQAPPSAVAAAPAASSTDESPESAAEIIARLSASGLWKEDASLEEPEAAPPSPEPAWKSLLDEEEQPPAPVAAAAAPPAPEEEDSIEAYMQRLLKRVSGDNDTGSKWTPPPPPPAAGSAPVEAVVAAPVVPAELDEQQPEQEPFDPKTYVPRSTAPELSSNLAAMRELANDSARTAIDTSSKRQLLRTAATKMGLSMVALLTNFALWWLALQSESLMAFFASVAASVCSVLWFLSATWSWFKASRREKRLRAQQPPTAERPADAEPSQD